MTIKTVATTAVTAAYVARFATARITNIQAKRAERKYETMIAKSQAKLAETILVPGYTQIYA